MASDINARANKDINDIYSLLDNIDIDNMRSEGITLRSGNKIIKFEISEETSVLSVEDEIKNELKQKLTERIKVIREKVNEKIFEMSNFVQTIKDEYERKEILIKKELSEACRMPDITFSDASKGLSVVKGKGKGNLLWLVTGVYWPKYVDKVPLKKSFSKKMLSNVIYLVSTNEDRITGISTRKMIGLDYFDHYHQSKPDCWGNWSYPTKWKTTNDIISCAKEAEAVLENINTSSLAAHNPSGLPRMSTVNKNILKDSELIKNDKMGLLNQTARRSGITTDIRLEDIDIWSTA